MMKNNYFKQLLMRAYSFALFANIYNIVDIYTNGIDPLIDLIVITFLSQIIYTIYDSKKPQFSID
jgi:hypothetical protein